MLYFQMRQSRGACEKYHGAVLDHAGRTDTRSFREVAALGEELVRFGAATLGARTPARVDEDTNAFLGDVPGPLAALFGVRVEETDSAEPGVINPVRLPELGLTSDAQLVFELLITEGAEVVGSYTEDFYAGRPAVTRRTHPSGGQAWYVGTGLADDGLAAVLRAALVRHDLLGPYADIEDLECAVRERDGVRISFLLNHRRDAVEIAAPGSGTDLLSGRPVQAGERLRLGPADVIVLQENPR